MALILHIISNQQTNHLKIKTNPIQTITNMIQMGIKIIDLVIIQIKFVWMIVSKRFFKIIRVKFIGQVKIRLKEVKSRVMSIKIFRIIMKEKKIHH